MRAASSRQALEAASKLGHVEAEKDALKQELRRGKQEREAATKQVGDGLLRGSETNVYGAGFCAAHHQQCLPQAQLLGAAAAPSCSISCGFSVCGSRLLHMQGPTGPCLCLVEMV